jgi:hypothetical protein
VVIKKFLFIFILWKHFYKITHFYPKTKDENLKAVGIRVRKTLRKF